jgi:hypothetical protein
VVRFAKAIERTNVQGELERALETTSESSNAGFSGRTNRRGRSCDGTGREVFYRKPIAAVERVALALNSKLDSAIRVMKRGSSTKGFIRVFGARANLRLSNPNRAGCQSVD